MLNTFKFTDIQPKEIELTQRSIVNRIMPPDWADAFDHHQVLGFADLLFRIGFTETSPDLGKLLGVKPGNSAGVGTLVRHLDNTFVVWFDRDGINQYELPAYTPYTARWLSSVLSRGFCGQPALFRDYVRATYEDLADWVLSLRSSVHVVEVLGPLGSVRSTGGPSV